MVLVVCALIAVIAPAIVYYLIRRPSPTPHGRSAGLATTGHSEAPPQESEPAWCTDKSVYAFLASHRNESGMLAEEARTLPHDYDEESEYIPADLEVPEELLDEMAEHLARIARTGHADSQDKLYALVVEKDYVVGYFNELMAKVVSLTLPIDPHLVSYAHRLATRTDKKAAVKLGIAILAYCQTPSVTDDVVILGLHQEFTPFAQVAVSALTNNNIAALLSMAKNSYGWGKVHMVACFSQIPLTEEVRHWLLREGCKDTIVPYVAQVCASEGRLKQQLEQETIDAELFDSASYMMVTLAQQSGEEDSLPAYDVSAALTHYIRHAYSHTSHVRHLATLVGLRGFLVRANDDREGFASKGWHGDTVVDNLIDVMAILKRPEWPDMVRLALRSHRDEDFRSAKGPAEFFGIDLTEMVWQRLREDAQKVDRWVDVINTSAPEDIDAFAEFARQNLCLKELSTGLKNDYCLGTNYRKSMCVNVVMVYLENHPGKAKDLILSALHSSCVHNRRYAVSTLLRWGTEYWSVELYEAVEYLRENDPNAEMREYIEESLRS